MAIKNDILGGTDWNEGDILYAVDLNDTIDVLAVKDMELGDSEVAGDSGSTKTLSLAAGEVNSYVLITAEFFAEHDTGSDAGSANIDIQIGEAGSEASKYNPIVFSNSQDAGANVTQKNRGTIVYYYEPTSDEKTNGFNVLIVPGTGGTGADCKIGNVFIMRV